MNFTNNEIMNEIKENMNKRHILPILFQMVTK